jgi:membrane protease YdiL (CAAX protease family)
VDFLALSGIIAAGSAAGWLMFSFLSQIQSATQISDLLLSADVLIFMVMFLLGMSFIVLAWILGGISFGINLGDIKDFLHSITWGLVFAMMLGLSVLPTLFLTTAVVYPNDLRMVVALVLLAPVGEEVLSRGGTYGIINAYFPGDSFPAFIGKGLIPSALFAVGHFWAMPLTLANFAFTFLGGYILNFSYWYTHKLGVPMTAHFVWNLVQLFLQGII